MNKKISLFALAVVVIAGVMLFFTTQINAAEPPPLVLPTNTTFFHWDACGHCTVVKNHIIEYSIDQIIVLDQYEIRDPLYRDLYLDTSNHCGSGGAVPLLYHAGECFVGSPDVIDKLDELAGITYPEPEPVPVYVPPAPVVVEPVIEYAPISKISLPDMFNHANTSYFKELTLEESKNYTGLVIDVAGSGKVMFSADSAFDLSSQEIAEKFSKLDQYTVFEKGKIGIDTDSLSELNKPALIVFYDINLVDDKNLIINKDGEDVTSEIENLRYNPNDGIVSFSVEGFSEYSFFPYLNIQSSRDVEKAKYILSGYVNDLDAVVNVYFGEGDSFENPIVLEVDEEGNFQYEILLTEGDNDLDIEVVASSGETILRDHSVYLSLPVENDDTVILHGNIAIIAVSFGLFFIILCVVIFLIIKKVKSKKAKSSKGEGKPVEEKKIKEDSKK